MSEIDLDDLRSELEGFAKSAKGGADTAKQQRIIAGFEEIERFCEEHGRLPQHGDGRDIFERIYAVRLDRLRSLPACREILQDRDTRGLLLANMTLESFVSAKEDETSYGADSAADEIPGDDELAAELGALGVRGSDIAQLQHVRTLGEIRAAEEIAKRSPCLDFDTFRSLFEKIRCELKTGERQSVKFKDNAEVRKGDLFILDGQTAIVAEMGVDFINDYGRPDCRCPGCWHRRPV